MGVIQQVAVVNREKPLQRVEWPLDAAGVERARPERGRAIADHPADAFLRQSFGAALDEQRVGRIGDIAP